MPAKRYDWDSWLGRRRFTLRRGRDYSCSASAMAQQVRNAASLRRRGVTIIEQEGGMTVHVLPPRGEPCGRN